MPDQELEQSNNPTSNDSPLSSGGDNAGSQADSSTASFDDILASEREQIQEVENATQDAGDGSPSESPEGPSEEGSEPDGNESESEGAYKPNLKYKVQDKTLEVDDWLKPLITDEETETKVKDLLTKVNAFDEVKAKLEPTRQERDAYRQNFVGLRQETQRLIQAAKSGDFDSFFEGCGINIDNVAGFLLEKARIANLSPQEQAVYNERDRLRREQNVRATQSLQPQGPSPESQAAADARLNELDTVLTYDPQVNKVVQMFDGRLGSGKFRQAVLEHAATQWHSRKVDLSVKDAVKSFIELTGLEVPKSQPKPGATANRRVVAKPQAKTIPNFGNSQGSVVGKKIKSIADLKQAYKDKFSS